MTHYQIAYLKQELGWKKTGHELGLTFQSRLGSWRTQEDQDEDDDGDGEFNHFDFEEEF